MTKQKQLTQTFAQTLRTDSYYLTLNSTLKNIKNGGDYCYHSLQEMIDDIVVLSKYFYNLDHFKVERFLERKVQKALSFGNTNMNIKNTIEDEITRWCNLNSEVDFYA
jgi:protein-arginine kinase activator protein McsA